MVNSPELYHTIDWAALSICNLIGNILRLSLLLCSQRVTKNCFEQLPYSQCLRIAHRLLLF